MIFEDIKHIDEFGNEYWLARELQKALEYRLWQNFCNVIKISIIACEASNYNIFDHFIEVNKMILVAKGAKRNIADYKLSRYACYLIAQNSDPRKSVVALAQTYFAIQTRKQELFEDLSEDEKRIMIRERVRKGNLGLNRTAVNSGVKDLASFTNAGYKVLYNGETADDIFKRKKLRYREDILDNMGSVELADNLFRIIHTDEQLKNEKVSDEYTASSIHYKMGKDVREFIKNHGGTMPENLPTPKKSLNEINSNKDKTLT